MDDRKKARAARWACAFCFGAGGLVQGSVMGRIPALKSLTGVDEQALGQALLGAGLGALLAFTFAGALVRRLGSRRVTLCSAAALLLVFPLLGLCQGWWELALALLLVGLTFATLDVAMNTQAVEVERLLGRPCLSSLHGMYSLGGLLGALGAALLAGLTPFWHFSLLAALALLALPLFGRRLLDGRPEPQAETQPRRRGLRLPPTALIGLGLLTLFAFVSEGAVADWSALLLHSVLGASERVAALGFAAFSATMVIGRLFGDRLRLRCSDVALVRGLSLLAIAGMLLALFGGRVGLSVAGFALVGLGLSVVVPILIGAAGNRPGVEPSRGVAAVASFGYGGLLLGPPLIGILAEHIGLRMALLVVVALCAGLLLQAHLVRRPPQAE
ncbi:MFS transporter [Pseudomonas citronellolis]|uniref:MFS transporter n=1 Tax=Pseudomonas citronellolis TaxID=53408 RepID=UPI0023E3D475|nr:MFS transporter [Pseudomonas citronellolis]MDF3934302.1 MFS transporter [Pseudomonas citronellolis]